MSERPLEQLRKSAERILELTDGCESVQQAALRLNLKVNTQSNAPDRHQAMRASLDLLRDKVGHGMIIFSQLYTQASDTEEQQQHGS